MGHFFETLRISQAEMAQNSNHFYFEFNFSSNFGPSQGFDTWFIFRAEIQEKLNGSNFWPSQSQMHMPTCDMTSFNVFLSHLRWLFSRTLPYWFAWKFQVEIQLIYGHPHRDYTINCRLPTTTNTISTLTI